MEAQIQTFDFSKQMINATSKHIRLAAGDKVIWRKTNRQMYGVSFDIRCTVQKVNPKSVTVMCRWICKETGRVIEEPRTVTLASLWRYDWPESA